MRTKSIHTISLLASAIAMALPSTSTALGLGRLTVQSGLGQPLSAQIELTSAAPQELDSLAARIADPSLYRQNNLTYQGVLTRARVSLERNQNGQAFLRVITSTPVNEPYLDLMVELNWAAGRVVREYTFLLDPPGVTAPTPAVEPVTPVRAGAATAPRAAAPVPPVPRAESRGATSAQGPSTYAVRRGDSLARIANQLRPESVSLEQMLAALFKANPQAFDGDNMNRLRSGSILTVPSAEEIAGTPAADANRLVRMQAADWRTYRDRVAAGAPVTESAGGRETSGRITAQVQERTPAVQPGRDQVRVSRDASAAKGAASAEDVVARDRSLQEAQARIAELEKALNDLKRAMDMRSQSMAQLQTQAEAGKAKAGDSSKAGSSTSAAGASAPAAASGGSAAAKATEATRPPETVKAEAASKAASVPPKGAESPSAPAAASTGAPAVVASSAPKADVSKAATKTAKTETGSSTSMLDEVVNNTPGWVMGAGAIALLAGVGAVFAARRRKTASFEDSIISGTDIKSNTVFGSTGGGIVNTGENSLSSDFSREGLSTIDTDEVDPIAEAEVYLAYGRDAQAEEILKDALRKDPQRQEVYLKLLEIHAQHNKPSAFESVAAELYSVSKGQGEVWQKAVALGRQLDPNNPMFAQDGAGASVAAAAAVSGAAAATPRVEPSASPRAAEPARPSVPPVPVGIAELDSPRTMDFRLDDDISIMPTISARKAASQPAGPQEPATGKRPGGLAFTTEPAEVHTPERAMSLEQRIEAAHAAEPHLDLDFHLEDTEKPAPLRAARTETVETKADGPASLMRPQAAIDLDKLDLNFDPERSSFEDPTPSVLDGQWHDAATKLDLAKAYQEMGDVEGAREILQEVLHEGDEQQKGEAGALLAKLG